MAGSWFDEAQEELGAVPAPRRPGVPGFRAGPSVEVEVPPRPREAKEAAEIFYAVAAGVIPEVGSGPTVGGYRPPPTPIRAGGRRTSKPPRELPSYGGGEEPEKKKRAPTAAEGLEAILSAVRTSDDSFAAAGEWITKVTNGITAVLAEAEDEDE